MKQIVDGQPQAEEPTPPPPRPSPAHRPPPLHRQHRMEVEEVTIVNQNIHHIIELRESLLSKVTPSNNHSQVVPPPTSLPLHPTTNDNFPEDIRGYTHIPGPAPKLPRWSTRFHRHSSPLGARFPHGVTVCLPLTTMTPLACTLDLHTNHNNSGQKARHTREGRLATFGRYVDLNISLLTFWNS